MQCIECGKNYQFSNCPCTFSYRWDSRFFVSQDFVVSCWRLHLLSDIDGSMIYSKMGNKIPPTSDVQCLCSTPGSVEFFCSCLVLTSHTRLVRFSLAIWVALWDKTHQADRQTGWMVVIVPADGLAPSGAKPFAAIMMTAQKFTRYEPMVKTHNLTQTIHSGKENGGYNSETFHNHLYSCGLLDYFHLYDYGI